MKRQRGVTFVGMVFIAGLIVFGAILGFKLVPAYIEYATVTNHLREHGQGPEGRSGNNADIIVAFRKRRAGRRHPRRWVPKTWRSKGKATKP